MLQIYSAMSCYLNAPVCKQPNHNLPPASHIPPRQPDQIPDHPARPEIMLKPCFLDSRLKVLGVSCFHKFFSSTVFSTLSNAHKCSIMWRFASPRDIETLAVGKGSSPRFSRLSFCFSRSFLRTSRNCILVKVIPRLLDFSFPLWLKFWSWGHRIPLCHTKLTDSGWSP